MVSVIEAKKLVKKKFPDLTNIKIYDIDEKIYLVYASNVKDGETDFNDPYYLLDKETKNIIGFVPTMNIEAFNKAIRKGELQ